MEQRTQLRKGGAEVNRRPYVGREGWMAGWCPVVGKSISFRPAGRPINLEEDQFREMASSFPFLFAHIVLSDCDARASLKEEARERSRLG